MCKAIQEIGLMQECWTHCKHLAYGTSKTRLDSSLQCQASTCSPRNTKWRGSLGNIAVHPDHRGKGLARKVTAALVKSLLDEGIEQIGLNVSDSNPAAIACYTRLGFERVGTYEEIMWDKKK